MGRNVQTGSSKEQRGSEGDSKKNKARGGAWLQIVFFMLAGFVLGIILGGMLGDVIPDGTSAGIEMIYFGLALLAIVVMSVVHAAIHEAGHLVCGLLSGYGFVSYRVGSLMFLKKDGRICLRKYTLPGTGGQCLMDPPEPCSDETPFILYNLGGSLANLIAAGLFGLLCLVPGIPPVLRLLVVIFVLVGIALALMNGIPIHTRQLDNDGYNVLELRKNRTARRCFFAQMKANALQSAGIRLKDIPEELIFLPDRSEWGNHICAASAACVLSCRIDAMQFVQAQALGEELLECADGMPGIYRQITTLEVLFCELVGQRRTERIEELMSKEFRQFLKTAAKLPNVPRIWYAYELLYRGDREAADRYRQRFENLASNYPYTGEVQGERELYDYVDTVYEQRLQTAGAAE